MTPAQDNIAIIDSAEHNLTIVGHTLQKFLPDIFARQAIERALYRRVHVTLMLQNPRSRFVDAHSYERILLRAPTPSEEVDASLQTLRNWLKAQDGVFPNLRVVLTTCQRIARSSSIIVCAMWGSTSSLAMCPQIPCSVSITPAQHPNRNGTKPSPKLLAIR